jgi:isoleucyl-tRNA synthetase
MTDQQDISDYSQREEEILAFWNKEGVFEQSVQREAPHGDFTFYDGPPFATGLPHYGHLLQSAVKDAVPRYKTMRGYRVARQWGWDCHGLPIENIVEKELGTKSKKDIEAMGVKKFNDLCREKIFEYAKEWERIIPRFGRWADMTNAYKTMDTPYMESEWWAFRQLYDKGLIYEGYRSMHICPRCETTLSQGEVSEGYKDIKDLSVTAKFELVDEPGTYILAWTTTPWTLPGNTALAIGNDIEYATVEHEGAQYIVAQERLAEVFNDKSYAIVASCMGRDLVGKAYKPLYNYYAQNTALKGRENGWKVYATDFVTTDNGTGIVHIAPAFGTDDMNTGTQYNLPFVQHVGIDGVFKSEVTDFAGMHVKPKDDPSNPSGQASQATDVAIIKDLARRGLLFSKEKFEHSYPHCWRCDTPLLNYATSSWFVAVEKIKPTLLETAQAINWSPAHIKEGRWGQWLSGARDWSISRQRFWANTIPVWRCGKCKKEVVVGSIDELKKLSGTRVDDLHKDVVDEVTWNCSCGGMMTRVPDVLDTWFDSGSVPYATQHYPFENEARFRARLPVDFIAEAQDQTRAWFYYQHVLAGGLFGTRAFSNCIVTGIVLAEDGKKMSKKLQNYPDPMYMVDTYGADAMRLYMLGSPVVRTESLRFSETEVGEIARKTIGRLVNVYEFYALYAKEIPHTKHHTPHTTHILDQWMVARIHETHAAVTAAMDAYTLDDAVRVLHSLVDDLSTWYLRRSRERLKEGSEDALATLAWTLQETAKLFAPFAPFVADWVWQRVKNSDDVVSVHLAQWSDVHTPDSSILDAMLHARNFVTLGLFARTQANIKVRQPLLSFTIGKGFDAPAHWDDVQDILADELNVKKVILDPTFVKEGEAGGHWWLNTTITHELKLEGDAREIIRAIQDARKQAGKNPHEQVAVQLQGTVAHEQALHAHRVDIVKQTNASSIAFSVAENLAAMIA